MMAESCTGLVVVVDDEEDTRELLRELLEGHGYLVATAEDGEAALTVIGSAPKICLVILDLLMPKLDGAGVLDRLKAGPDPRDLTVWISTSAPERAPPGVPCLPKPVDVERLLSLVHAHCANEVCA